MKKIILILLSFWLGLSGMLNFLVLPTVFHLSPDILVAGKIGMNIFSRYNQWELFLAVTILICTFLWMKSLGKKWGVFMVLPLFLLTGFYKFFLTPKIIELTGEVLSNDQIFFHRLYVYLDGGKLLLILVTMISFFPQRKVS